MARQGGLGCQPQASRIGECDIESMVSKSAKNLSKREKMADSWDLFVFWDRNPSLDGVRSSFNPELRFLCFCSSIDFRISRV